MHGDDPRNVSDLEETTAGGPVIATSARLGGRGWRRAAGAGVATAALLAGAGAAGVVATGAQAATVPAARAANPVAKYLSVNLAKKTVTLTLLQGLKQSVGGVTGFDFDGYAKGTLTVSVPTAWHVIVHCTNKGQLPHSCAIVSTPTAKAPVFRGASVPNPAKGIPVGHTASFTFVAGKPGHYRIACLVPGHEPTGMWDNFVVTAGGRPSISVKAPATGGGGGGTTGGTGTSDVLTVAAAPDGALQYTKTQLVAPTAGKITIEFTNNSPIIHDLVVADPVGTVLGQINPFDHGTRTLVITLKKGVYSYYCSVDHHQLAGMSGTLIVK